MQHTFCPLKVSIIYHAVLCLKGLENIEKHTVTALQHFLTPDI